MNNRNTNVSISNYAMVQLGHTPIQALDEDTKTAKMIRAVYDIKRRAMLREHPWAFARKRVVLSPLAEKPLYDYAYQFLIPHDFIRLLDPNSRDFEIENGRILSNSDSVELIYIFDCTDEDVFDDMFCECLSYAIAAELARQITGSNAERETLLQLLQAKLAKARMINGMEQKPRRLISNVSIYEGVRF